jgi:hypothetical protein
MGVRLSGRGPFGSTLTRAHGAGLDGGARLVSALGGTLLIAAALLHVSAAGDHTNLPVMLTGFLVVATLQAALGGLLLLRRPGRLVLAGGLALTLGSLAVWLVSRTAGLPFLPGGHMEPIGFKDGVTVLFEVATVPVLAILWSAELDSVRLPSPRLGTQAVAVLGSGVFALFVPALVLGGGEHHSAGELAGHMHGEGDHDHAGEELAQAAGAHDGDHGSHDGSAGHDDSAAAEHPHGQPATADFFANAHENAGHARGGGSQMPAGGHEHAAVDGKGGGHQHTSEQEDGQHHGGGHPDGDGDAHSDPDDGDGHAHGEDAPEHADDHGHAAGAPEDSGTITFDSGQPQSEGEPTRSPAILVHDQGDAQVNGEGHSHGAPCKPTAEQQAAADAIVADVRKELVPYENNPAAAIADGFDYVFGPTDRMLHMVALDRVNDPDALKASEIESFIYYMTDTGFVPIGGMFMMPRGATSGPQPGGCLTQWHSHGGFVARWATAGTSDSTPLMMHVFTYPGLDPWGHYTGRDLAPLWTPGRWVPSLCRQAEDANNGCLP